MRPTIIVRSLMGRIGFFAVAALCAVLIGQALWVAGPAAAARLAAYPAFVLVIVWLVWFYPNVQVSDSGVRVTNPLRNATIPFDVIAETTSRGALRIVTSEATYTAWAAPARGGYRESTRPPAASPDVKEGTELLVISADAATTARLIDEEKIMRSAPHYRRESGYDDERKNTTHTGWTWNAAVIALVSGATLWVIASAIT